MAAPYTSSPDLRRWCACMCFGGRATNGLLKYSCDNFSLSTLSRRNLLLSSHRSGGRTEDKLFIAERWKRSTNIQIISGALWLQTMQFVRSTAERENFRWKFNQLEIIIFMFFLRFWETDIRAARKINRSTIRRKNTLNNKSSWVCKDIVLWHYRPPTREIIFPESNLHVSEDINASLLHSGT